MDKTAPLAGMTALLLAAGKGTRLMPITEKIPKCLVDINGEPLLGIWIKSLVEAGIDRIMINTHYLHEMVFDYCVKSKYRSKIDLRHEKELLGSVGTLLANYHDLSDTFFMAHADNLSIFSFEQMVWINNLKPASCLGTMMTFKSKNPRECGIVEFDEDGILKSYIEKPVMPISDLANAAIFIVDKRALEPYILNTERQDFCKDILPITCGKWIQYHNEKLHYDIGSIESLSLAKDHYKRSLYN